MDTREGGRSPEGFTDTARRDAWVGRRCFSSGLRFLRCRSSKELRSFSVNASKVHRRFNLPFDFHGLKDFPAGSLGDELRRLPVAGFRLPANRRRQFLRSRVATVLIRFENVFESVIDFRFLRPVAGIATLPRLELRCFPSCGSMALPPVLRLLLDSLLIEGETTALRWQPQD
jgi:hypothetical protein